MTPMLRTARCMAMLVALAAIAAFHGARANHFILTCDDDCSVPRWVATGSLNTARHNHTATLLRNGKVLVAGGSNENGVALASVELYDPATETWSITGSMATRRAGHFAFRLPTGAVLVIGGDQPCCRTSITAELYDPDTGTWSPAGNRGPIVGIYVATMLQTGKVLVTDAIPTNAIPHYGTDAWLFDVAQQTWNQTGGGLVYRQYPDATLLQDGKVLVVGGTNDADEVVIAPGAELYDPATAAWRMTGSPSALREAGTDTALPDGSVLAAGGFSWTTDQYSQITYSVPFRNSESYDPDGMWRAAGDLNEARSSHTATLVPGGRVLIAGGGGFQEPPLGAYRALRSAELYDPTTAAWSYTSFLNVARMRHTATLLDDGSVLVVGGVGGNTSSGYALLSSAELYLPGEPPH
jgi:N-acetylneuraminic acid mutarotase